MMKVLKLFLFIPAVFFTGLFVFLQIVLQTFGLLWTFWMILLWASAILMSKGKVWGVFLGLLPAIDLIVMGIGNKEAKILNEQWLGWPLGAYILLCGLLLLIVKLHKKKTTVSAPVETE